MKILVTGSTGFVGAALIKRILREHIQVYAALVNGRKAAHLPPEVACVSVPPLSETCDYKNSMQDVDVVIHLAARVHVMKETDPNPLERFRAINTKGTANLARQAAASGVKRFVFLSTIGVNGGSATCSPFTEHDYPNPRNPYSISKKEAEEELAYVADQSGMEVVILRAPLVYGPGNPGNFLSLLRNVSRALPLPLGSVQNKRSFVYVGNLVDAIAACMKQPGASGQTYLVSDGEDISTPELIERLAVAMGKKAQLFPFPLSLLRLTGKVTGKSAMIDRLIGSLQVDSSKIRRELGWTPPFTMEQGLRETVEWYKCRHEARGDGQ